MITGTALPRRHVPARPGNRCRPAVSRRDDAGVRVRVRARHPRRVRLHRQRRHHAGLDAGRGRRRLRVQQDADAGRAVPRRPARRQRPSRTATAKPLGDGPGDHARAGASWLTGVHPKKTRGADIRNGMSVDQMLAETLGRGAPLPSMELGLQDVRMVGGCDSGYSCAYSNTISWSSPTTPLPYENNPSRVFARLFGDGDTTDPAVRAIRTRQDRSLLDFVLADATRLRTTLGAGDRRKLSDYLDSVREVERRIGNARYDGVDLPVFDRPDGIPPTFEEHVRLMSDLIAIAFQADLTRVVTLMYSREGGNRTYRSIGVPDAHHGLSHHQNDPEKMARLQMIDRHHVALLAYFLGKLRGRAGTRRDRCSTHSMVVYGSSLSDSNAHTHDDLPALGGRRRQRRAARRAPPAVRGRHADDEPVPDPARPPGRAPGPDRRQHGADRAPERAVEAGPTSSVWRRSRQRAGKALLVVRIARPVVRRDLRIGTQRPRHRRAAVPVELRRQQALGAHCPLRPRRGSPPPSRRGRGRGRRRSGARPATCRAARSHLPPGRPLRAARSTRSCRAGRAPGRDQPVQ